MGWNICLALSQLCLANAIHVFHGLFPYFLTWTVLYCTLKNKCLEYLCPLCISYEKHIIPHAKSGGWFPPGALLEAQQHIMIWKECSGKTANSVPEERTLLCPYVFKRKWAQTRKWFFSDKWLALLLHVWWSCRHLLSSSMGTVKLADHDCLMHMLSHIRGCHLWNCWGHSKWLGSLITRSTVSGLLRNT